MAEAAAAAVPPKLVDGVYKIISTVSGQVVTIASCNNVAVYPDKDSNNQKWRAKKVVGTDHWTLQSLDNTALYLDYYAIAVGSLLRGSPYPRRWQMQQMSAGSQQYKMWVPDVVAPPDFLLDLYQASHDEGTVVQLWPNNGTAAQVWFLQPV